MISAAPTPARTWLTRKKTAADASTAGSAPAIEPIGASCPSAASTSAEAASESPYWAALKVTFTGESRAWTSAIADAAPYASTAGSRPNSSSTANANAVEIATRSAPSRRGTSIGISSPTSTRAPISQNRQSPSGSGSPVTASAHSSSAPRPETVAPYAPKPRRDAGAVLVDTPVTRACTVLADLAALAGAGRAVVVHLGDDATGRAVGAGLERILGRVGGGCAGREGQAGGRGDDQGEAGNALGHGVRGSWVARGQHANRFGGTCSVTRRLTH